MVFWTSVSHRVLSRYSYLKAHLRGGPIPCLPMWLQISFWFSLAVEWGYQFLVMWAALRGLFTT